MSAQLLPNPDVYLNHFLPEDAVEFEFFRNFVLVVLGATIWDNLLYVPEDIEIVRRRPFHPVTLCFIFSRLFALAFVLLGVLQHTQAYPDRCKVLGIIVAVLSVAGMGTTSFLILRRALAVCWGHKWTNIALWLLWLASCGAMTMTVFGAGFQQLPGTGYCVEGIVHQYTSAAGFVWFFFELLVFATVSYKIATSPSSIPDDEESLSWGAIITGRGLPKLSRIILQGGQQYFFIIIMTTLPVGIIMVIPSTPQQYKLMLGYPAVTLAASMACRIVRNVKMYGTSEAEPELRPLSTLIFTPGQSQTQNTIAINSETSRQTMSVATQPPRSPVTFKQTTVTSDSGVDNTQIAT